MREFMNDDLDFLTKIEIWVICKKTREWGCQGASGEKKRFVL